MYEGKKRFFEDHTPYHSRNPGTNYFEYQSQIKQVDAMLIYTDIIEDQITGDSYSSLLQFSDIKVKADKRVVDRFDIPHYVGLCTRYISEIKIEIKDVYDNFIRFQTGFIHLKLHIRKRQLTRVLIRLKNFFMLAIVLFIFIWYIMCI